LIPEGFLSHIFILADVLISGPFAEEGGKHSISITRKDGQRMRGLRREDEDGPLNEFQKTNLTLIFSGRERALLWKNYLEKHVAHDPKDVIEPLTDGRMTLLRSIRGPATVGSSSKKGGGSSTDNDEPLSNSVLGMLVIPTSGAEKEQTENLKLAIARSMST